MEVKEVTNVFLERASHFKDETSEFEVTRFEKVIGFKLPNDYRNFLLNYRGGFLGEALIYDFIENGENTIGGIESIYGFCENKDNSLYKYYKDYCDDYKRMMLGMIPIGDDGSGNYICLLLAKKDFGKIYFWDHEWEVDFNDPEESQEAFRNCHWIADSFTEFTKSIRIYEE
ncbi:MAG: SMI1/KNR4 family protein [Flavobacterium sp.]|nr:MAG: SMI1/KNR4 family protein [Flavobacterium sp.]